LHNKKVIKPTKVWFNVELEPLDDENNSKNYDLAQSQFLKAQKLFEDEINIYTESNNIKFYI